MMLYSLIPTTSLLFGYLVVMLNLADVRSCDVSTDYLTIVTVYVLILYGFLLCIAN